MRRPSRVLQLLLAAYLTSRLHAAPAPALLEGTRPLEARGDLSALMVGGIDKFLDQQTRQAASDRARFWHRDFSSPSAYEESVQTNRATLAAMIGATDPRLPAKVLELDGDTQYPALLAQTESYSIYAVRWPVFEGVHGEGLWIEPKGSAKARVVAIPDADQTPEMLAGLAPGLKPERQFARRLAEHGCRVLVPVLLSREDTWSGNERLDRFTNQPHREWIYRQAFMLGRHIIGYEVQKVLAALDLLTSPKLSAGAANSRLGVAGYAEGGLIALYTAALDNRVDATLVTGYFDAREKVWQEPIYRNVFGFLEQFGDAEVATLIAPRALVVEYSETPKIQAPPRARPGRSGAAPGTITTPDFESVEREFDRARSLVRGAAAADRFQLISGTEGMTTGPVSDRALAAFLTSLGIGGEEVKQPIPVELPARPEAVMAERQHRQVKELEHYTQRLVRDSEAARDRFFWNRIQAGSEDQWRTNASDFRAFFRENVIGRFSCPLLPAQPRSRPLARSAASPDSESKWVGYEVVLDVFPDVFSWGYLLIPKDLSPGERRPVVVCQHGLEGLPADVINRDPASAAYGPYQAFASRLCDRGFVVFAPHNPYRGGERFRQLQRKANPLGKSLFSVIVSQHEQILNWLRGLSFVDAERIGFYGLSYGGKTAMRVPALLEGYALSICSGDFNEWVRKNTSLDYPASYMFLGEYEMLEFDLGNTFNYAEMAALIAPRPFMVERGHDDGVGKDEWVAYEYAKVRRFYDRLGIGERTAIEFFNGGHTINGKGTFDFLSRHLNWPRTK